MYKQNIFSLKVIIQKATKFQPRKNLKLWRQIAQKLTKKLPKFSCQQNYKMLPTISPNFMHLSSVVPEINSGQKTPQFSIKGQ